MTSKIGHPSAAAFAAAALRLGCKPAAIRAVAFVEAGPAGAFLASGEPVQLFERHWFHRLTAGRFDEVAPELSSSSPFPPGGYGSMANQPAKVAAAAELDWKAAHLATSWGLFQIMGFNHTRCGFPTLEGFLDAMLRSVDGHLEAFVGFVGSSAGLRGALQREDFVAFARRYNGPNYARNEYHLKMLRAFRSFGG